MTWASRRVFASRRRQAIRREGWRVQREAAAAAALEVAHQVAGPNDTDPDECPCVWCLAGKHEAECPECLQFWYPDSALSPSQLCRIGERIEQAIAAEFATAEE